MGKSKKILFIGDAASVHMAKWVDYFVSQKYNVYLFQNERNFGKFIVIIINKLVFY